MEMIKDLAPRELVNGITGYYRHATDMTFGLVQIKAGTQMAAHNHVHEQITYMIDGEMEMQIGDETVLLKPGAVQVIPSNVVHSARAITECQLIDVFSPIREDYR
ncbi:MAG: cupin domain-containing protein [Chitinophagaceae bacterium]